jgi:hypothetical protein
MFESMAHREFTDARQVTWQVWDVHPNADAHGVRVQSIYANGWLAFESPLERRRLAPIPDGWQELGEAMLQRLCDDATPVPHRRQLG